MKVPPPRSALLIFFAMALGAAPVQAGDATSQASEFHRGVSYVHSWRGAGGYGTSTSAQSLAHLRSNHVGWIALNPFGYQSTLGDTSIRTAYDRRGAETDEAMAKDIAEAHELGLRVMLKPHLWISRGEWPGEITFQSEEDWAAWFASYERMILHYAEFAQRTGVDYFCIGCELKGTTSAQPARWRKMIAKIREVFSGPLVYAANWDEYQRIVWWDALDAIGINAYFPLSQETDPSLRELRRGARGIRERVGVFQRRISKPVIFTEIGYRSMEGAAARPWEYRESKPMDLALQERCYRAMLETFWDTPWLLGMYWWKWFSSTGAQSQGYDRDPFSPRNKPAERTLSEWYAKAR